MTTDFTGERVIPGQVDANLWNEHVSRYAFASRLARGRRVLDAGCGTGYGSAELASIAHCVTGMDVAEEAVGWGRTHYSLPNVRWTRGSCEALPFAGGSFDLVVAFEVIEHLTGWREMLTEARRVLAPGGQLIVSTPNKQFYAKTRELEGPNPYHEHEFEYTEFRDALCDVFPHVSMFLEDHTEGVLFRPVPTPGSAEVRVEQAESNPEEASFYIAVCAMTHQTGAPTFVYIPKAANLLAEKILHIERLEGEVATKDEWLKQAQTEHRELLAQHRALGEELAASNVWAEALDAKLRQAGERIVALQNELAEEQAAALEVAAGYEAQLAALRRELEERTRWAAETGQRLTAELEVRTADLQHQTVELGRCVEILHQTEATLEERTRWAMQLEEQRAVLEGKVNAAISSRWLKLGRAVGLGPELDKR